MKLTLRTVKNENFSMEVDEQTKVMPGWNQLDCTEAWLDLSSMPSLPHP